MMDNMVMTLVGGMLAIATVFLLMYRFSRFSGKAIAATIAIIVAIVYPGYAAINWPGADVFAIHIAVYLVLTYILGIISSQRDARKRAGEEPGTGIHWAPATITGFFLFIIIADSMFIMVATKGVNYEMAQWLLPKPRSGATVSSNFPGTVSHDFQEKEAQYNAYLNRVREQSERGWQVKKGWLGEPQVGKAGMFRVTVKDKHGEPVSNAEVRGSFMRPGNSKLDQDFSMEEKAPGDYFAVLTLTEQGTWNLTLKINHQQGSYESRATTTVTAVENTN
jgi:nitrogen fixation protein FixH